MRDRPSDKMRTAGGDKANELGSIPGVSSMTALALRRRGITTLEQLRTVDLRSLPAQARAELERWRDG